MFNIAELIIFISSQSKFLPGVHDGDIFFFFPPRQHRAYTEGIIGGEKNNVRLGE